MDTCHEEIIHDISFNYYGNRFATASTDQTIKVYSKVDGYIMALNVGNGLRIVNRNVMMDLYGE